MNAILMREISALPRLSAQAAGRGAKPKVGIETLLQWAYAAELVHGALIEGAPALLGIMAPPQLATACGEVRVSESRNSGFVAPADAYAVHRAVLDLDPVTLALPNDCVPQWECAPGFYRDEGRAVAARSAKPRFPLAFDVVVSSLVMEWAMRCDHPDWIPAPCLAVQRGAPRYATPARKNVVMQQVRFVGDMPWEVEKARLIYRCWVGALADLQDRLSGRLERFELTCELPEPIPWLNLIRGKT